MASKFADAISVRFLGKGKGKSPAPMSDEADDEAPPASPDVMKDDDGEEKPGDKGKTLLAAIRKGNAEAVEEAIRAICE